MEKDLTTNAEDPDQYKTVHWIDGKIQDPPVWVCTRLHPPYGQFNKVPAGAPKCNVCGMPKKN